MPMWTAATSAPLMLTFFFRFMRPLIEGGYVYIAQPPLFKLQKGQNVKYAYNDAENGQAQRRNARRQGEPLQRPW